MAYEENCIKLELKGTVEKQLRGSHLPAIAPQLQMA